MHPVITSHLRPYPFKNCPRVHRDLIGSPEVLSALERPLNLELDRMATLAGLKPSKLSQASLVRLLPGIPPIVLHGLVGDAEISHLSRSSARQVRLNVGRRFKENQFRAILARSGAFRKRRIFVEPGGKPSSMVSWLADTNGPGKMADFLVDLAGLAEGWGLEMKIRSPFWFHGPWHYGLELHRPGRSILAHGETTPRLVLANPVFEN